MDTLLQYLNPTFLIQTLGLIGVLVIIFAESGLFFGFFLPGDSLLFTAGLFASQGYLNITLLILGGVVAAILGDNVGYAFGRRVGPTIFNREDSILFHKEHLVRARTFYEQHGVKTIILARFVPIVRTFAPIVAGMGGMKYATFLLYNIIGGFLWVCGLSLLGFTLGNLVPDIDRYLLPIVLGIIFLSFIPVIIEYVRHRFHRK